METPKQKQDDIIGSGLFGIVKRETIIQKDKTYRVAKKILNIQKIKDKINKQISEEIKNTKARITQISKLVKNHIENCNITQYYDDTIDIDGKLAFKMELCNYNLIEYLDLKCPKESPGLDIGQIYDILVQLNNAFRILVSEDIKHGNIKLENILVNFERNKKEFKLSGFEIIPELIYLTKVYRQDRICKYLPPEILDENDNNNINIDQKTDLWSLGVVIYYLCFKEFPYKGDSFDKVLAKTKSNERRKTNFTELDNLIDGLLNINKEQRLTWLEYLSHPFFKTDGFWKEYTIVKEIGRGKFSIVYEAKNKKDKTNAAIKIIDFSKIIESDKDTNTLNYIKKEIKERNDKMGILSKEYPDYFVKIYKEFDIENGIAIAMEICDCNLKEHIEHISKISEPKATDLFYFLVELNKCLKILDRKEIIIGNLKLENILLKKQKNSNNNYIYKLTDFYLCPHLYDLIKSFGSEENICYFPPEVFHNNIKYNNKCDLWSLGIVIYYFRFKSFPYNFSSDIKNQIKSNRISIKSSGNEQLNSLIDGLLKKKTENRLTWDKYFHHDFFINRDYNQYYQKLGDSLAEETCCSIYKVKEKKTGLEKVIKIINKDQIRKEYKTKNGKEIDEEEIKKHSKYLVEQTKIMKMLEDNDENINTVKFFEYFNTRKEFVIVMEKCDTDLNNVFGEEENNKHLKLEEIKDILIQLNNTFRIMAEKKIMHGDLKLGNILIKKENNKNIYKLTDYGVSKEFLKINEELMAWGGAPQYSAPEYLKDAEFDLSSDLWSLGIILYTLFKGKEPYEGNIPSEVLNDIDSKGQNNLNQISNDPQFDNLIRRLLTVNPKDRITWDDYFEHPFLEKGDCWKYYEEKQLLGKGQYFKVYKVKNRRNGEYRAIKVIYLNKIKELYKSKYRKKCTDKVLKSYIDDFIEEIKIMEIRRGPNKDNINTLAFDQFFQTDEEFCIVREFCDGDLFQLIEQKGKFTVKEIYQLLIQLNNTFKILQKNNQSVRDLRLEEILYNKNVNDDGYTYKISSFEHNKKIIELINAGGAIVNNKYKAPEILSYEINKNSLTKEELNKLYQKADLWNIGIIAFFLYFGEFPYYGNKQNEVLNNIRKNEQARLNEIEDLDLKDLLKKLLVEDKDERIDWKSYFNHKFFSEEKWK